MGFLEPIIKRDGTSQRQRLQEALDPTFIKIEERQLSDLLNILGQFAEELAFYNQQNIRDGSWVEFFPAQNALSELFNNLNNNNDLTAHLALLISFLKLLGVLKEDLNQLSAKHLKFYYTEVLKFIKKKAIPDSVHVLFGLAKNATTPYLLEKGSLLNAGKDENGEPLFYETDRNIIVNQAQINSIKTILVDLKNNQQIFASPVANSADGLGSALNTEDLSWHTFGESQQGKPDTERSMPDAEVGFAVASPLLLLKVGNRTIDLHITFQRFGLSESNLQFLALFGVPDTIINKLNPLLEISFADQTTFEAEVLRLLETDFDTYLEDIIEETKNPFRGLNSNHFGDRLIGYCSTKEDWYSLNPVSITISEQNKIILTFEMNIEDPALVHFQGTDEINGLPTKYPALKILLNPQSDKYEYAFLRDLKILSYELEITVNGVRNLVIHNENGPQDAEQAFLPFGPRPSINANLYIGSSEIFQKRLNSLSLTIDWADLPTDSGGFSTYYDGYTGSFTNANREADIHYLQMGNWVAPPSDGRIDLFNVFGSGTFSQGAFTRILPMATKIERNPEILDFDTFSNNSSTGFVRLSLRSPDFGHHVFQNQYAQQALAIANETSTAPLPNIPYTPKLKSISLNYSSKESVVFGTQNTGLEQFFHIEPFGSRSMSTEQDNFCFPQFSEGTLLLGIEALSLPQNLSVLLQVLEGSADPDISIQRNDVSWSYLNKDEWITLTDNEIQIDSTQGLQTSGILDFSIPSNASTEHSLLQDGLHWLKAEIDKNPAGISKTIDIHSQAMSATFVNAKNTLQQFSKPLEAETISKLVSGSSVIKTILQPYGSFGGRPAEKEINFLNRISERLRHKQRAKAVWDYERIVLEGFPFIYKVKCLNHAIGLFEESPGYVTLIVIPDLLNKNAANPLQPKTSFVLRESIKDYVASYVPLFVTLTVDNPKYEPILVDLKVGLKPGFDGSFYGNLLNEQLKRYLSPWAFESGEDIIFGGRIYKSSILAFIEEQEYVDYITDFRLFHLNKSPGIGEMCVEIDFEIAADTIGEEVLAYAEATTARSILVSANKHTISVLQPGEFVCTGAEIPSGIGTMIVEYDFIVS